MISSMKQCHWDGFSCVLWTVHPFIWRFRLRGDRHVKLYYITTLLIVSVNKSQCFKRSRILINDTCSHRCIIDFLKTFEINFFLFYFFFYKLKRTWLCRYTITSQLPVMIMMTVQLCSRWTSWTTKNIMSESLKLSCRKLL